MNEFWMVTTGKMDLSGDVDLGTLGVWPTHTNTQAARRTTVRKFDTEFDAIEFARQEVKKGTGDLYVMKQHKRFHLPVLVEAIETPVEVDPVATDPADEPA